MTSLNITGRITEFFLSNRPLTVLLFLLVFFVGIFGYISTPKQYNPEVTLPAFQISIDYPGASAEEVENFVTKELEQKIMDIEGVDTISSRSVDGGVSIVTVEFHIGEDLEESKVKLQTQILQHSNLALGTMKQPLIKNINPNDVAIVTVGFTSKYLHQNDIRLQVLSLLNVSRSIEGVANLKIHGGERRTLRILLDPGKMKLRKVSPMDVKNSILQSNKKVSSGEITNGRNVREIEVSGVFLRKQDAENILVLPGIKLSDIATVEDGYSEKTSFVKVMNHSNQLQDVVFLSFAKKKGTNSVVVSENILQFLESEIKKPLYADLQMNTYRNEGITASKAINDLGGSLFLSVLIVVCVLFFFLGMRAAFIVAISIPLTLLLVFFIGFLVGETINRITLFSLILSLGLLVDSATVVVENITRHMQGSKNKRESIVIAVNEVGIGLFFSTITSVIVFLPTSQVTGMMGAYMGPLSFFVPIALILSLLVAYIFSPLLADLFFSYGNEKSDVSKRVIPEKKNFFQKVANKYEKTLHTLLYDSKKQKRFLSLVFGSFLLVLLFLIIPLVHFKMLPTADKEQYYVYIDAPEGTDTPETQRITESIMDILIKNEETKSIQSFTGVPSVVDFNGLYKGAHLRESPHVSTLRVNITDPEDRWISSEKIVQNMRENVQEELKDIPSGTSVRFIEDPPGPPVLSTFVAKIKGPDHEVRNLLAQDFFKKLNTIEGITDKKSSKEYSYMKTVFGIDHEKALNAGISTSDISGTLQAALTPYKIDQFHISGQEEFSFIEMQFKKNDRDEIQDLSKIYIKNVFGEMIPLDSVTKRHEIRNIPIRYRDEQENTTYLFSEMGERSIVYALIDLISYSVKEYTFPVAGEMESWDLFGVKYRDSNGDLYTIEWGGEWKMTLENFRDLGLAMLVSLFMIYLVLVAQFRSFKTPALLMVTIPLGFLGILPGFALLDFFFGEYLTATTLIGFIALMGIVVNNAILYLEYFHHLESRGMNQKEALIQAGKTRLRPIFLTSITTVLGSLTIVFDPVWSGLAWAIVFGLSLSSFLTLGVFPILYDRYGSSVSKKEEKELATR